jgi:hypothetical protein
MGIYTIKMSKVNCKSYDSDYFLIPKKCGKETYSKIAKKLNGEWIPGKGWKIHYDKEGMFINYMDVAFGEISVKVEARPDEIEEPPPGSDEIRKSDSDEEETSHLPREKFRRARSAGKKEKEKEKEKDTREYYDKFKKSPEEFSKMVFDDDHLYLSSSDENSSDDSDSSEDYPSRSPKRETLVNDGTIDKMELIRRRMIEMELRDKKKNK